MDKKYKKQELANLLFFAKKVVDSRSLKRIKALKDIDEKIKLLKYSVKSRLELDFFNLRKRINHLDEKGIDVFHMSVKANLLSLKIKYFNVTHHKKDFKKILLMFKKIRKDINNV